MKGQKPGNRTLSFDFSYAPTIPLGAWGNRFGYFNGLGGSVHLKSEKHRFIGIEGQFNFGNQVKNTAALKQILLPSGEIVNRYGQVLLPRFYMRGIQAGAWVAFKWAHHPKIPNNGWILGIGSGYIQHHLRLEVPGEEVPQLTQEYKKGYDRLHSGFYTKMLLGYHYMEPEKRMINGMVLAEFGLAATKNARGFNFDEGRADTDIKNDTWITLRMVWMIPRFLTSRSVNGEIIFR